MGFHSGSDGKESACNAGDLGLIPGLGRSLGERKRLPTPVFWLGEFHGLSMGLQRVGQDSSLPSQGDIFLFFLKTFKE